MVQRHNRWTGYMTIWHTATLRSLSSFSHDPGMFFRAKNQLSNTSGQEGVELTDNLYEFHNKVIVYGIAKKNYWKWLNKIKCKH